MTFLIPVPAEAPQRLPLEGPWRLVQAERKIDVPAVVPGVVQTDLMRAGLIPDPYFATNEKAVQWVGDLPWSYSRRFEVPAAFLAKRRIVLRCEGIDTFATIRINGREVAKPDNFFRTWEFDAKPFLEPGENTIQIDFETLGGYIARNKGREARFGKPEQEGGKPYVRKPAFQGGWDFAPRLLTTGIWRNIGLVGWDAARLTDVGVAQDHAQPGGVGLTVRLAADVEGPTTARTTVLFKGRKVAESKTSLTSAAETKLTIRNPQLWWPNEMGPQSLYDVRVELTDASGQVLDQGQRRIGLRTVTWIPKTKENPLGLVVNGRRFFAKGSNWVPYDSLLREDPAKERTLLKKAADAHMNLMRIWGGGYYPNDAFFDACDELGILAWFEFGYANSPYPSFDPEWMANAKAEAEDAVRRTRNHPSIAVYSGNNEVIDRVADKPSSWQIAREDYERLFGAMLRDVVRDLAPDAAYTPGSPEIGDTHYWNVWHGSEGFDAYTRLHGFVSEYGYQAAPVPRTVEAFAAPAERTSFGTPAMQNHHKNWRDAYALIAGRARRTYRAPKDIESAIWLGQIQQAEGILTGVEHWRRDWPDSTASLVWQFNDPWPVTSWSMVDYYARPKALYYRLKHAYAPVALTGLADPKTGQIGLWVANDRPVGKSGNLEWTLTRADGTLLDRGAQAVAIPGGTSSARVLWRDLKPYLDRHGANDLLLWATLKTPDEPDSNTLVTFAKPRDLSLVDPGVKATVAPHGKGYRITLKSSHPALHTWVELKGMDADLSDNFVHFRPGAKATLDVLPVKPTSLEEVKKALVVRSLYDTYLPGAEAVPITQAEPDGRIVATAANAEILGDTAILENEAPSNIGSWRDPGDTLRWTVRGAKAGAYDVTALVAVADDQAGGTFEVSLGEGRVVGTVPPTGGWTSYATIRLGTLRIDKDGEATLALRPLTKPHDNVMNLRSITLTPAKP